MAPAFQHCESHPGKPLTDHLRDVSERLAGAGHLMRTAGLFHDVAKATEYFQQYLNGRIPNADLPLKQHAHLGAMWLLHYLVPKVNDQSLTIQEAVLAYLMVANHHTGLNNALDSLPPSDSAKCNHLWCKQLEAFDLDGAATWLGTVLNEAVAVPQPELQWTRLRIQLSTALRKLPNGLPAMHRFQNALRSFGLLVEADRDSASGFAPNQFETSFRFNLEKVERFRSAGRFGATADSRVIEARELIYQAAVAGAQDQSATRGHLWSLTVPTGAGKTLAAIGWALRRREARVAARRSSCPIIYALPFTSIIDQNASVLRNLWDEGEPDESILALHHHIAEPGELAQKGEQSLARSWVEGWRADIVCTTFVQVVNALFHGTVADARRFSRLAGSILILDEVQAIPAKFWRAINSSLLTLCNQWGTDILLVTATQPAIFELRDVQELGPKLPGALSTAFDRYDLIPETRQELTLGNLAQRIRIAISESEDSSCLVILNTIHEALDLYSLLLEFPCPIFHLSTNLRPKDRKRILKQIANCQGQSHLVIATQVVEAGVDLSFDLVFRALAPLDAVVQAAGRCNRHGTGRRGKVFLIRTAGNTGHLIYGNKEVGAAQEILEQLVRRDGRIPEPKLREGVSDYFRIVASRTGRETFDRIMAAIQMWEFACLRGETTDPERNREKAVRLIDERDNSIPHFVEMDESDVEVWGQYRQACDISDLRQRRAKLRRLRPQLAQRIVEVPKMFSLNAENELDKIVSVSRSIAHRYYDTSTGWIRERM
jgi:CRISPR-associated endonuclease/helicase Cas3